MSKIGVLPPVKLRGMVNIHFLALVHACLWFSFIKHIQLFRKEQCLLWSPFVSSCEAKMAAILQLSQYCTFSIDSISTVITEPGQPVSHCPWDNCSSFIGCKGPQKSKFYLSSLKADHTYWDLVLEYYSWLWCTFNKHTWEEMLLLNLSTIWHLMARQPFPYIAKLYLLRKWKLSHSKGTSIMIQSPFDANEKQHKSCSDTNTMLPDPHLPPHWNATQFWLWFSDVHILEQQSFYASSSSCQITFYAAPLFEMQLGRAAF